MCVCVMNWFTPLLLVVVAPHNQAKAAHYSSNGLYKKTQPLFRILRLRVSSSLDFDLHGRVFVCKVK